MHHEMTSRRKAHAAYTIRTHPIGRCMTTHTVECLTQVIETCRE